jgi:hypothetical protein
VGASVQEGRTGIEELLNEEKRMKRCLLILASVVLAACASTTHSGSFKEKMARVAEAAGTANVMVVPNADNAISSGMVLAALKAGQLSRAGDQLVRFLKIPQNPPVGVVGDNDAIVAATIEAALKQIEKGQSNATLYYTGDAAYIPKLKDLAEKSGVNFVGLPYPLFQFPIIHAFVGFALTCCLHCLRRVESATNDWEMELA